MTRPQVRLRGLLLLLALIILAAGCKGNTPAPAAPSPSLPSQDTSVLPTPSLSTSILPTPPVAELQRKLLLLVRLAETEEGILEISDPDGTNHQMFARVAPDARSVAVSPDQRYLAFFTSDAMSPGTLQVWDLEAGERVYQTEVAAATSASFRDASPTQYLAWSPDSQNLAAVINRDLHHLNIPEANLVLVVPYREEQYAMAGWVVGSIKRPAWTADGSGIVYDTWSPPDILSESADTLRDVEHVDLSTGMTQLLAEDTRIANEIHFCEPALLLERQGRDLVELDLNTLEIKERAPSDQIQAPVVCDRQCERCASIVSNQEDGNLLRLGALLQEGAQVSEVHLADLGESAATCRFQSVLSSPDGDEILATVGCADRVSLWSIRTSDLEASRISTWDSADLVALVALFE